MELDKTKNWPYYLLGFSILFIIVLGGWWLYLVFTLAIKLKEMDSPILQGNLVMMVQWEGVTFLTITIFVAVSVLYVFYQDNKKSRSTQLFYASLTHELKTPLASMRLQSQVLTDLVKSINCDQSQTQKIEKYSKRLEEDSIRLEDEIDRHLQLSRIDLSKDLNIEAINLSLLLKEITSRYGLEFEINNGDFNVLADQSATMMIFKNLIENTLRHQSDSKRVSITLNEQDEYIKVTYNDHGKRFEGETQNLKKLFYKHNSPKGSGIGLYLINKLMHKQTGKFIIHNNDHLVFDLFFKKGQSLE